MLDSTDIKHCICCGRRGVTWWLTPQQQEVLALLAQGLSNPAIGETLHLDTKTVENYINILFHKMELSDPMINKRVKAALLWLGADET